MPSITALRALLGASLGLGAVDLVVIDVVLAPEVVGRAAPAMPAPPTAPPALPTAPPAPTTAPPAPTTAPPPAAIQVAAAPAPTEPSIDMPAQPVSSGQRVYFATMSATLDERARDTLDQLAAAHTAFVLEGHADQRGDDSYNQKLSRKRALAARDYLVAHGVDRDRIEVRYKGEIDAEEDRDLWRDRRVDILISGGSR